MGASRVHVRIICAESRSRDVRACRNFRAFETPERPGTLFIPCQLYSALLLALEMFKGAGRIARQHRMHTDLSLWSISNVKATYEIRVREALPLAKATEMGGSDSLVV